MVVPSRRAVPKGDFPLISPPPKKHQIPPTAPLLNNLHPNALLTSTES